MIYYYATKNKLQTNYLNDLLANLEIVFLIIIFNILNDKS